jgi:hypothetical protein
MKLRIATGTRLPALPPADGMVALSRHAGLVVEATDDVRAIRVAEGRVAFVAGDVVGIRGRAGDMRPTYAASLEVRELVSATPIADACETLEGRFVVGVVDGDTALVAADRFGQTDLYYQSGEGWAILASDLSLLPVSGGGAAYDPLALAHALTVYGYRPPKRHTAYRGVRRVGVGEVAQLGAGRITVTETAWQPLAVGTYGERELHEYADLLLDAVRVRGSRYGNVVYLSSGWDSTSILACLVELFGPRKVRAVIGRMQYAERSGVINQFEIDRARAMAEYYGVRLDVAEFDYRKQGPELLEGLAPLFRSHGFASMTAVNHGVLADHVARTTGGDEAVFAGEISDGVHNLGFSQYVTIFHPVLAFREYSDKMASYLFGPTFFGLLLAGQYANDPIYALLRGRAGDGVFEEPARDAAARKRQMFASFFLRGGRLPLWSLRNTRVLTDAGRDAYSREMEAAYLARAAAEVTPETLYAWYLRLYNSFHWQGSTVATIYATAEARGLRMNLPFWDSRLQEFLSAMPESWGRGLDLNPTKYPLKWALAHRIDYPMHLQTGPHSYLYDVDPSFSHTAELLYGSAFAPYFRGVLGRRAYRDVLAPDVFEHAYLDGVVGRYLDGNETRGVEMNDLLTLSLLSSVGWYGRP